MRTWERDTYTVNEVEFDGDLHEFDVNKNGEVIATITPDSVDAMYEIILDLDNGVDVDGWEDGKGNVINTNIIVEVTTEHVKNELEELAYRNEEIVYGWMRDDRVLNTIADDFNDLEQPIDEPISLKRYLDLIIDQEMYDK